MNNTKINAVVVADSINSWGNRITSLLVTMPRLVLAEFNTHRMFSRNTSSSRAIPFNKMVESVEKDPFIPIAWQKDHKGMQGNEYFNNPTEKFEVEDQELYELLLSEFEEVGIVGKTDNAQISIEQQWLYARDNAIISAKILSKIGITKQLCNRLLEPFMWTTVLVTATEWENFFALRCPQYIILNSAKNNSTYRSRKDLTNWEEENSFRYTHLHNKDIDWLKANKGQAEIHMMALAEAMWDAINESTPKQLKAGEWHIPFGDNIDFAKIHPLNYAVKDSITELKIATARCARVSYTVVGEEDKPDNYENDIKLHDRLIESGHWSPFEHCAKVPTEDEYRNSYRGNIKPIHIESDFTYTEEIAEINLDNCGWFDNFHGFQSYRNILENETSI